MKILITAFLILLLAFVILLGAFESIHQQNHRVIQEGNYKLQIIQNLILWREYDRALKILNEWGVEYCQCVAWSEQMIKIIGNKRYAWINGAWHRVPKRYVIDMWKKGERKDPT